MAITTDTAENKDIEMQEDIYDDINNIDLGNDLYQAKLTNAELMKHIESLNDDVVKLTSALTTMKIEKDNLATNISSLYSTAKAEIERKDRQITELQKRLDDILFRRNPKRKSQIDYSHEKRIKLDKNFSQCDDEGSNKCDKIQKEDDNHTNKDYEEEYNCNKSKGLDSFKGTYCGINDSNKSRSENPYKVLNDSDQEERPPILVRSNHAVKNGNEKTPQRRRLKVVNKVERAYVRKHSSGSDIHLPGRENEPKRIREMEKNSPVVDKDTDKINKHGKIDEISQEKKRTVTRDTTSKFNDNHDMRRKDITSKSTENHDMRRKDTTSKSNENHDSHHDIRRKNTSSKFNENHDMKKKYTTSKFNENHDTRRKHFEGKSAEHSRSDNLDTKKIIGSRSNRTERVPESNAKPVKTDTSCIELEDGEIVDDYENDDHREMRRDTHKPEHKSRDRIYDEDRKHRNYRPAKRTNRSKSSYEPRNTTYEEINKFSKEYHGRRKPVFLDVLDYESPHRSEEKNKLFSIKLSDEKNNIGKRSDENEDNSSGYDNYTSDKRRIKSTPVHEVEPADHKSKEDNSSEKKESRNKDEKINTTKEAGKKSNSSSNHRYEEEVDLRNNKEKCIKKTEEPSKKDTSSDKKIYLFEDTGKMNISVVNRQDEKQGEFNQRSTEEKMKEITEKSSRRTVPSDEKINKPEDFVKMSILVSNPRDRKEGDLHQKFSKDKNIEKEEFSKREQTSDEKNGKSEKTVEMNISQPNRRDEKERDFHSKSSEGKSKQNTEECSKRQTLSDEKINKFEDTDKISISVPNRRDGKEGELDQKITKDQNIKKEESTFRDEKIRKSEETGKMNISLPNRRDEKQSEFDKKSTKDKSKQNKEESSKRPIVSDEKVNKSEDNGKMSISVPNRSDEKQEDFDHKSTRDKNIKKEASCTKEIRDEKIKKSEETGNIKEKEVDQRIVIEKETEKTKKSRKSEIASHLLYIINKCSNLQSIDEDNNSEGKNESKLYCKGSLSLSIDRFEKEIKHTVNTKDLPLIESSPLKIKYNKIPLAKSSEAMSWVESIKSILQEDAIPKVINDEISAYKSREASSVDTKECDADLSLKPNDHGINEDRRSQKKAKSKIEETHSDDQIGQSKEIPKMIKTTSKDREEEGEKHNEKEKDLTLIETKTSKKKSINIPLMSAEKLAYVSLFGDTDSDEIDLDTYEVESKRSRTESCNESKVNDANSTKKLNDHRIKDGKSSMNKAESRKNDTNSDEKIDKSKENRKRSRSSSIDRAEKGEKVDMKAKDLPLNEISSLKKKCGSFVTLKSADGLSSGESVSIIHNRERDDNIDEIKSKRCKTISFNDLKENDADSTKKSRDRIKEDEKKQAEPLKKETHFKDRTEKSKETCKRSKSLSIDGVEYGRNVDKKAKDQPLFELNSPKRQCDVVDPLKSADLSSVEVISSILHSCFTPEEGNDTKSAVEKKTDILPKNIDGDKYRIYYETKNGATDYNLSKEENDDRSRVISKKKEELRKKDNISEGTLTKTKAAAEEVIQGELKIEEKADTSLRRTSIDKIRVLSDIKLTPSKHTIQDQNKNCTTECVMLPEQASMKSHSDSSSQSNHDIKKTTKSIVQKACNAVSTEEVEKSKSDLDSSHDGENPSKCEEKKVRRSTRERKEVQRLDVGVPSRCSTRRKSRDYSKLKKDLIKDESDSRIVKLEGSARTDNIETGLSRQTDVLGVTGQFDNKKCTIPSDFTITANSNTKRKSKDDLRENRIENRATKLENATVTASENLRTNIEFSNSTMPLDSTVTTQTLSQIQREIGSRTPNTNTSESKERRRITPIPVKDNDNKSVSANSFENILEKSYPPTFTVQNTFHLTHEGEIPQLHIEENHLNNLAVDEGIKNADNSLIKKLLDTMDMVGEFKSTSSNSVGCLSEVHNAVGATKAHKNQLTFENCIKITSTPIPTGIDSCENVSDRSEKLCDVACLNEERTIATTVPNNVQEPPVRVQEPHVRRRRVKVLRVELLD